MMSAVGIINGFEDGTYRKHGTITKSQIYSKIFYFVRKFKNEPVYSYRPTNVNKLGHWAFEYYDFCLTNSFIEEIEMDNDFPAKIESLVSINEFQTIFKKVTRSLDIPYYPEYNQSDNVCTRGFIASEIHNSCAKYIKAKLKEIVVAHNSLNYNKLFSLLNSVKSFAPYFSDDYYHIASMFAKREPTENEKAFIIKLLEIDKSLQLNDSIKSLQHYTSMRALNLIVGNKSKLRLSNTVYLNDALEGKIFNDEILKGTKLEYIMTNSSTDSDNLVNRLSEGYVASFSISNENNEFNGDIPMWVQYGDNATGAIICLDINELDDKFYGVHYDSHFLKICIDKITYQIEKLGIEIEDKSYMHQYLKAKLHLFSLLIKHKSFENEKEARIVKFVDIGATRVESFIREGEFFPRVYAEVNGEYRTKHIVLGPRSAKSEFATLTLCRWGVKKIYKSDLPLV